MPRVLILDGHSAAALALVRSLGRAGYWIAVGTNLGMPAPAEVSRYCQMKLRYPVASDDVSGFVDVVAEVASKNGIDLIIPVTDWTVLPLSQRRQRFNGITKLALGPHSALELAADKYRTVCLARELGIRTPETALIQSGDELKNATSRFKFPAVIKDRFSARWIGNRAVLGSVSYAYSAEDLKQKVQKRLNEAGDVLVQEFIAGEGIGFSCLSVDEGVRLPFMWRRIREIDPRGSGSSAAKSIAPIPEVRDSSSNLVARAGLQGICMVEYKRPYTGGQVVLMEINGRPWGTLQLPISCGINYPVLLVEWLLNGKLPPEITEYKVGLTFRRLVSELTHLEHTFHGTPPGWPIPYPSFLETLMKISLPWYPGVRYSDVWITDPAPGAVGLRNWFRGHLAKAKI